MELIGVDRHGQLVRDTAVVAVGAAATHDAFLGSRASFGFFAANSRILDSTGKPRVVSDIIQGMSIDAVRFETAADYPNVAPDTECFSMLWRLLQQAGAESDELRAALKTRSTTVPPAIERNRVDTRFALFRRIAGVLYCVIERRVLESSFSRDWSATIIALADCWLRTPESGWKFENEETFAALWLLSALRRVRRGYRLVYDGLQFSAMIEIHPSDDAPSAIDRGATAFLRYRESNELIVTWPNRSWNPIVNGFVLSAS